MDAKPGVVFVTTDSRYVPEIHDVRSALRSEWQETYLKERTGKMFHSNIVILEVTQLQHKIVNILECYKVHSYYVSTPF